MLVGCSSLLSISVSLSSKSLHLLSFSSHLYYYYFLLHSHIFLSCSFSKHLQITNLHCFLSIELCASRFHSFISIDIIEPFSFSHCHLVSDSKILILNSPILPSVNCSLI